jgi:hypothetical protein
MEKIKEIVVDLMECYDGAGVPNQHYVKNKVAELHDIVKNINCNTVLANCNATLDRCECEEPKEEPIKVCLNCNGYIE